GSQKVNPIAGTLIDTIQGRDVVWRFGPPEGYEAHGNWPVSLYRREGSNEVELIGKKALRDVGEVHTEDYGVIMRGPHPLHAGATLMVMAGAHSLGTGAACIAATRSQHIRKVKEMGIDISNRQRSFWVLVRGVESTSDGLLDVDGVTVVEAGIYSASAAVV